MSTSYNINSISIQHRYSVIIPGIGSSDPAGPCRAGKPRNWCCPITHISWWFLRVLVLPFLPSLLDHLAHLVVEARIWFVPTKCVKNLKQTRLSWGDLVVTYQARQQGSQKTTAMQKFTSSSTKNGAIKKAWTRLSRRAGARFCNEDKVCRSMGVITKYIVSRLIAWQRLASKTPWPMNCIVQQTNWATNTTFNKKIHVRVNDWTIGQKRSVLQLAHFTLTIWKTDNKSFYNHFTC